MSLAGSKAILRAIKDAGETGVLVAFSAGKDSIAVLDMCVQEFERVEPFFLYTIPDLECEERFIRRFERKYGLTVHRFPNPLLSSYLRAGYMMKRKYNLRRILKWSDILQVMRDRTGLKWVGFGHRMDESLQRRGMIRSSCGLMRDLKKFYPLWDWSAKNVYAYLRSRKIEFPENYGQWDTAGSGIGTSFLKFLQENYPSDYEKCRRIFPVASAKLYREEIRLKEGYGESQAGRNS